MHQVFLLRDPLWGAGGMKLIRFLNIPKILLYLYCRSFTDAVKTS